MDIQEKIKEIDEKMRKMEKSFLCKKNDEAMKKEMVSQMDNKDRIGFGDYVEYKGYVGVVYEVRYRDDDYLKENKHVEFNGINVNKGDHRIICELEKDVKLLMKCPFNVAEKVKERSIDFDY